MWGQGVVFPVHDRTWSPGTNSWICSPRGNGTLSCTNLVTWFIITQLFHLLWNLISPYLRQICWHLFYYGRGPPIHNFVRRRAMGLWGHPESGQSGRKQVHPGAVSMIHLESVSLRVWLAPSTIPELWGLYAVCNFHLIFKVLLTCYTKSATKARPLSDPMLVGNPNLGTSP